MINTSIKLLAGRQMFVPVYETDEGLIHCVTLIVRNDDYSFIWYLEEEQKTHPAHGLIFRAAFGYSEFRNRLI